MAYIQKSRSRGSHLSVFCLMIFSCLKIEIYYMNDGPCSEFVIKLVLCPNIYAAVYFGAAIVFLSEVYS